VASTATLPRRSESPAGNRTVGALRSSLIVAVPSISWLGDRPLVVTPVVAKPTLRSTRQWTLGRPGTCSGVYSSGWNWNRLVSYPLTPTNSSARSPQCSSGIYQTVNDISVVNELSVPEERITSRPGARKHTVISGLIESYPSNSFGTLATRVAVDTIRTAE
jgi:hypothetical protein